MWPLPSLLLLSEEGWVAACLSVRVCTAPPTVAAAFFSSALLSFSEQLMETGMRGSIKKRMPELYLGKGYKGGAWKKRVEVHAMGCMARTVLGMPCEVKRNIAVGVRKGVFGGGWCAIAGM